MLLLLGLAGFVMLIAIIWCIRNIRHSPTTLEQHKTRWHQDFKKKEIEIAKEQQEISTNDQVHFLQMAVWDLLRLEEKESSLEKIEEGIRINLGDQIWYCTYYDHAEQLKSLKKTLHGQGHWILKNETQRYDFKTIEQLMHALTNVLRGEPVYEEEIFQMVKRRAHLQYRGDSGAVK
ncbi:MAG: hypothetical protein IK079_05615 [Desulfovibrio sp.]|nr:hypothetical protein [Desulfovibrio sp.]